MSHRFGIIGGGVMGEALLSRLVQQSIYQPDQILIGEASSERQAFLSRQYGVSTTSDNQRVLAQSDVVLLAIKPQVFDLVVRSIHPSSVSQLVLSILAGVPLSRLETAFPGQPVVRAMPNTPATVGAGMTAIALGGNVTPDHTTLAHQLFGAVGEVVEVPESLMDAVTGLSGSGPGYIAVLIEALTDGGVAAGLPRATAATLALQTVRGTAELLVTSGMHPAELKDRVTSPGGTTIAGIAQLERSGFRSAIIEAVQAACRRSKELGA